MVRHLGVLRMAFSTARDERLFTIEAIVILPERCMPSGRRQDVVYSPVHGRREV